MRKTRSFLEYLDDIGWRNRVNESSVGLSRNADSLGLLINVSDQRLAVSDRRYCIAPKDVVKLLASRKITGVMTPDQDELDEIITVDEMYDFLVHMKAVPKPIAKMIAYDLWFDRDPDTPVVVDPARYHIEIEDHKAFVENVIYVFRTILRTTHSLSSFGGGVQVYVGDSVRGYEWMVPGSMGIR